MNQIAHAPGKVRFWVRPYEFEGDGSNGAAVAAASIEVGGKARAFWIKTLENRLFFREIGRDENWSFGAVDELSDAEKSDLPGTLARVLASENYGRVLLPYDARRPCLFLATPDERVLLLAPRASIRAQGAWMPQNAARARPFIERPPSIFNSLSSKNCRGQNTIDQAFTEISQLPIRVIRRRWARGTQSEWERVFKAFSQYWWRHLHRASELEEQVRWELQSAWAMQSPTIHLREFYRSYGRFHWLICEKPLRSRAEFICRQFLFVGQGKCEQTDYSGLDRVEPRSLHCTVSQPTHHETLEANLYLRDWIYQKLPPAKAKKWLDFP